MVSLSQHGRELLDQTCAVKLKDEQVRRVLLPPFIFNAESIFTLSAAGERLTHPRPKPHTMSSVAVVSLGDEHRRASGGDGHGALAHVAL